MNKSLIEYPEIASQLHPNKNGKLKAGNISFGSHKRLWWKCYDGKWPDGSYADDHEWQSTVNKRTSGRGCPCCNHGAGIRKVVPSNCLETTHPEIASQLHPTKNGLVNAKNVVAGSELKLWWKCYDGKWPDGSYADDHEWQSSPKDRTKKNGTSCPCCTLSGLKKVVPSNCLETTHPEIASQLHPSKNGLITAKDITAGSNKRLWWKCYDGKWPDGSYADDHEWKKDVQSRKENGCPCCAGYKVVPSNCLETTHPEIASQLHPTKNGLVNAKNVVAGTHKKLWWLGTCNHEWLVSPNSRIHYKTECPLCREFKGEQVIRLYLETNKIPYKPQYSYSNMRFDFAVEMKNGVICLIEYDGEQHYIPTSFSSDKRNFIKLKNLRNNIERDCRKNAWCKGKNYLLRIPFWDFNRIQEILDDFLSLKIPVISEMPLDVKNKGKIF